MESSRKLPDFIGFMNENSTKKRLNEKCQIIDSGSMFVNTSTTLNFLWVAMSWIFKGSFLIELINIFDNCCSDELNKFHSVDCRKLKATQSFALVTILTSDTCQRAIVLGFSFFKMSIGSFSFLSLKNFVSFTSSVGRKQWDIIWVETFLVIFHTPDE